MEPAKVDVASSLNIVVQCIIYYLKHFWHIQVVYKRLQIINSKLCSQVSFEP